MLGVHWGVRSRPVRRSCITKVHNLKSLSNNFHFDVNLINFDRRHTKTNSFSSHRMTKVQIAGKIVLFSHFCRPMTCLTSTNKSKSKFFLRHKRKMTWRKVQWRDGGARNLGTKNERTYNRVLSRAGRVEQCSLVHTSYIAPLHVWSRKNSTHRLRRNDIRSISLPQW
jgi:hypothetical protein